MNPIEIIQRPTRTTYCTPGTNLAALAARTVLQLMRCLGAVGRVREFDHTEWRAGFFKL